MFLFYIQIFLFVLDVQPVFLPGRPPTDRWPGTVHSGTVQPTVISPGAADHLLLLAGQCDGQQQTPCAVPNCARSDWYRKPRPPHTFDRGRDISHRGLWYSLVFGSSQWQHTDTHTYTHTHTHTHTHTVNRGWDISHRGLWSHWSLEAHSVNTQTRTHTHTHTYTHAHTHTHTHRQTHTHTQPPHTVNRGRDISHRGLWWLLIFGRSQWQHTHTHSQ